MFHPAENNNKRRQKRSNTPNSTGTAYTECQHQQQHQLRKKKWIIVIIIMAHIFSFFLGVFQRLLSLCWLLHGSHERYIVLLLLLILQDGIHIYKFALDVRLFPSGTRFCHVLVKPRQLPEPFADVCLCLFLLLAIKFTFGTSRFKVLHETKPNQKEKIRQHSNNNNTEKKEKKK